ncbi:uncharacterized protein LOC141674333 [Apium graveolens]|uniref:uncharacterized protein LOC141674333 n=1 Tax=Apium graveolens TaxID=4045 RepID=UPI003D7B1FFC
MDIVGHQFTWERGRDTNEWMEVRLDRALVNLEWLNLFPMAKLYNLEGTSSDHSPILLVPQVITQFKAQFRFKFENAWMMEPMCEILVQDGWYSDSGASIFQKLKCCSKKLAIWGREVTGNFSGRIKSCKVAMQQYRGGRDVDSKEKYREARNKLTKILSQTEVFWRQRSKQLWLQAGDQNSKFFHMYASNRRRNNQINKLKNEEDQWVEWESGLAELMSGYFSTLFTAMDVDWQEVVGCIPTTITETQNGNLL